MEELYSPAKKNEAMMALINRVKNTQFVKKTHILDLNSDSKFCFFCQEQIDKPYKKQFFIFCSRICQEIFHNETKIFQNIHFNENPNIYMLPMIFFQKDSQDELKKYIRDNRDEKFDRIKISYRTLKKDIENGEFKEIDLTFKYQKNHMIYKTDVLKLTTILFKLDIEPYIFFIPNDSDIKNPLVFERSDDESEEKTRLKDIEIITRYKEILKDRKRLNNSLCLYCNRDLSKLKNVMLVRPNINNPIYFGSVCSYFCSQVILTNFMKHICPVKTFFNFPLKNIVKDTDPSLIDKLIKSTNINPNFFLKTSFNKKKQIMEITQEIY